MRFGSLAFMDLLYMVMTRLVYTIKCWRRPDPRSRVVFNGMPAEQLHMVNTVTGAEVQAVFAAQRWETARRLCLQALAAAGAAPPELTLLLHDTLRQLGDPREAARVLAAAMPADDTARLVFVLRLADDCRRLSNYDFFRGSEYEKRGLTGDEYADLMLADMRRHLDTARPLAVTPEQKQLLGEGLRACGLTAEAAALVPTPAPVVTRSEPVAATGTLAGTIRLADGAPAAQVRVTLGLHMDVTEADPASYLLPEMHYLPKLGDLRTLCTTTDGAGSFRFESVPAGTHEFLAVNLDPAVYPVATRFLAQDLRVVARRETRLDLTAAEWQSAPAREVRNPFPATREWAGCAARLVHADTMANPFHYSFPRQLVSFALPPGVAANPERLRLLSSHAPDVPVPFQLAGDELLFFAELPALTDHVYGLYEGVAPGVQAAVLAPLPASDGCTAVIDIGRAAFRIPWGCGPDSQAPILGVRGPDGVWRGAGRLVLPASVTVCERETQLLESGPLRLSVRVSYRFSGGQVAAYTLTWHRDEAYVLVHEVSPVLPGGGFEFSLREFSGGRGYLHWTPENGSRHWSTLAAEDRLLARLQEQTPWWIPPQGFGYAMTADGLAQQDYLAVFSLRRGEWIDREFARLAQGPGDAPAWHRELDWPYPEMVGSTVSMITAHTTAAGDAFFRFGFFDGERHWGLLASSLERNDGPWKELIAVQHGNSSPRLQDFKKWHLDVQDAVARPHLVARRADLPALRRKIRAAPFDAVWARLCADTRGGTPVAGMRLLLGDDVAVAWRKKKELVGAAHIRARMTLLGREFSDMYSPVGARPITPWVEDYDLLAASGVFTPDEERLLRQTFMLFGHLYLTPDFMNWRFNCRNANFEADRVDVIGAIGLAFQGSADAPLFLQHVTDLMAHALRVYCTPGSGKWYENPACYYLQASKCRANLAYHLWAHGIFDASSLPRFKDFLRWGILLLMPPTPHDYGVMRDGTADWAGQGMVRRLPPVGDHAHIGPWVPEHYALMSKLYRAADPAFADELLWAYQSGGADGGYFGSLPLLLAAMTAEDLRPVATAPVLASRRLEGFGAVFRGDVGGEREFYLLLKQGPGGYRFHRTEGSFILFANGQPLVYDGGEAGETWRHSTLSFHATHMPLAPGHVERFLTFSALDFCQGVHPVALSPGQQVFLSDDCRHELVPLAFQRYHEPDPANARSFLWIKDDYVLVHDDLLLPPDVPSCWHVQAVADAWDGSAAAGYRFRGRFGTDLQLLLPGPAFVAESVTRLPQLEYHRRPEECFATLHLQLDGGTGRSGYVALLRPLPSGAAPLAATIAADSRALRVTGPGLDDCLFLSRDVRSAQAAGGVSFAGRYAAVLRRPETITLALLAGSRLAVGDSCLESDGPAAQLTIQKDGRLRLQAEGAGTVNVTHADRTFSVTLTGNRVEVRLG